MATNKQLPTQPEAASPTQITLQQLIDLRWEVSADALALQRGLTGIPGLLNTNIRGQGLEFDDLRPYLEGDDIRHIDWNVTARSGRPHIRLFREERERTVTIAIDLSPTMYTGTAALRAVVAARSAAQVAWHTALTGGRVSLICFDGQSMDVSRPMLGERGAISACAKISEGFDRGQNHARMRTFEQPNPLLDWTVQARRESGLTVLITGMDAPGDQWEVKVAESGRAARLAILWIRDATEINGVPAGNYSYQSVNGPTELSLTRVQAQQLTTDLQQRADQFRLQCLQWQVPLAEISTRDAPDALAGLAQAAA